jgi:glycine cleavage system protein P-like pyridoxal-binding family
MHECVFSARQLKAAHGVSALDLAKGLLDRGYHPPTVYFPLVVPEALMIEPTETESRETLDGFIAAMLDLAQQAAQLSHLPCRQLPAACAPGGRGLDGQSGLGAAAVAAAGAAVDQAGVL